MSKRKPIGRLIGASPIVDGEVRSSGVISTGEASGSIGAFDINNALRFDGSGDYLEWTPPTDGNMDKWTWSGWVKRHVTGTFTPVFGAGSGTSAPYLYFGFSATSGEVDTLRLDQVDTGSVVDIRVKSEEAFSSTDTWYHVIVSYDSLNSTAANRLKWWVNGQSVDTDETNGRVYPSSGQNTLINDSTKNIWLGRNHNSYGKVSLAEVHFLDGYAIQEDTPSITVGTFGEYNSDGVWVPKEVTGVTYGYNGFYLDFSQPSSTTNAFNSVLYVGDGSTSNQVTGVGFSPDLVWLKNRDAVVSHGIFDTVRGVQKRLRSDTNGNEVTQNGVMSFNADGFTLGDNTGVNTNGDDHVAWCWKAGGSSNTFNIDDVGYSTASAAGLDAGTITPTGASVNTAAGFSIIGYEGNETSGATVSHGLNQTPELIMIKTRDLASRNWYVGSSYLTSYNNYLFLDTTDDEFSSTATFNNTAPTSSVFTLGNSDGTNASSSMIAYCWHSVPGYSKIGSYVGNGSSNGPIIKTGFRPAFIMIKNTTASTTHDWHILDNARDFANPITYRLLANEPDIESSTATAVDFLADGFQLINNSGARNASNNTYIYMAFADTSPNLGVDRTTDGTGVTLLLDGESSTIADVSSNTGSNFTNNGIVQNTSNEKYGTGSLEFDGVNDYATFDMPELDGDYTIEFWYKPKSLSNDHIVLDMRTATNTGYPIIFTDANGPTNYAFRFWHNSAMRIDTTTVPVVGTWMHVAVVRSSGVTRMFINGTQEGAPYPDSSTFSTDTSTLGIRYTGGTFPTDAYIDDFRVTVGVARYTDSFTPPTSALSSDVSGITGSDDVVLKLNADNSLTDETGRHTPTGAGVSYSTDVPFASGNSHSFSFSPTGTSDVSEVITLPNSTDFQFGSDPFTIEMWFKWDGTAGLQILFNTYEGTGISGLAICLNGSSLACYITSNSGSWDIASAASGGISFTADTWHHLAIVRYADGSIEAFKDGVKGTSSISTSTASIYTNGTDDAHIGGSSNYYAFNGLIDDVRITKGAALYAFHPPISALTNDDTWDKPKNDFSVEGNITPDDQLLDTPNLRFATWDTSTPPSGTTLSNGNLTVTHGTTLSYGNPKSTLSMSNGKYYFECHLDAATDAATYGMMIQVADTGNDWLSGFYTSSGDAWTGATSSTYGTGNMSVGGVVGVALNADTGTTWFSVNGVWQKSATASGIADGTDTNYAHTGLTGPFYFAVDDASSADRGIVTTANFGQDHTFAGAKSALLTPYSDSKGNGEFYYQPPEGFLALAEIEKTKVNTVRRWNGLIGNSVARRTTSGKVIEHSGIITTSEHYQSKL